MNVADTDVGKENPSFLCNSVSLCPPLGILDCTKCRSYNQCFIAQATALSMLAWSMQCVIGMWSTVEIKCSLFIYMHLFLKCKYRGKMLCFDCLYLGEFNP